MQQQINQFTQQSISNYRQQNKNESDSNFQTFNKQQQQKQLSYQNYNNNQNQNQNYSFKNQPNQQKIITQKDIQNRRYNKLLQLRQHGYFSQQAIKLRQPLLYHIYIGQYTQKIGQDDKKYQQQLLSQSNNQLLSQFLSKDLINLQYKKLLSQEINSNELQAYIVDQTKKNENEIKQIRKLAAQQKKNKKIKQQYIEQNFTNESMQIQSVEQELKQIQKQEQEEMIRQVRQSAQKNLNCERKNKSNLKLLTLNLKDYHNLQYVSVYLTQQQMTLQEQALIQQCQLIFLKGQQKQLDYNKIDNNEKYDNIEEINKDSQQKYFAQEDQQLQEGYQNYYTGVDDY